MIIGSKIAQIGFHIQASDMGVTRCRDTNSRSHHAPPLLAPCIHLRVALLRPTSNWQTLDLHNRFIFGAHRPLETNWYVWESGAILLAPAAGAAHHPPFLQLPLCAALFRFSRSRKGVKVAGIQHEHIQKGGQKASLYLFPSQRVPSGLFQQ